MTACIALLIALTLLLISQDAGECAEIAEIERQQRNAPRKRRRLNYVDHHA